MNWLESRSVPSISKNTAFIIQALYQIMKSFKHFAEVRIKERQIGWYPLSKRYEKGRKRRQTVSKVLGRGDLGGSCLPILASRAGVNTLACPLLIPLWAMRWVLEAISGIAKGDEFSVSAALLGEGLRLFQLYSLGVGGLRLIHLSILPRCLLFFSHMLCLFPASSVAF